MDGGLIMKDPHAEKIYGKPLSINESANNSVRDCKSERRMRRNIKLGGTANSSQIGSSDQEPHMSTI